MIPPPIPIIPESKPIAAPVKTPMTAGKLLRVPSFNEINIRMTAKKRQAPKICLYVESVNGIRAPIKAAGMDPSAKG